MVDKDGFRFNVGIVLLNPSGKVFLGRRTGIRHAWQFPQGGIDAGETPEQAMLRELNEELGLKKTDVKIYGSTAQWLPYLLPKRYQRPRQKPCVIGQKQKWFLLKLMVEDTKFNFLRTHLPEFDEYKWVNYWEPIHVVIDFKREVYKLALEELLPLFQKALNEKEGHSTG